MLETSVAAEVDALIERVEEGGCVAESEVEALAARLELSDDAVEEVRDRLADASLAVVDDCGREAPATVYANGDLAHYTVDAMDQFYARAARHRLLTGAEELELARRIERGDLAAKEKLIAHNLRLVMSVARRYPPSTDMPLIDLVQEGTLGLIRAAEKFDWRRGYRFSTYATLWIRQAIMKGMATKARVIRLPHHIEQRERTIARTQQRLAVELGRDPTSAEIAERSGLSIDEIGAVHAAPRVVTSLQTPVGSESGTELGALLPDTVPDPGHELHIALGREAILRALAELTEEQRRVIELRYGIDGETGPSTYVEIGRRLGMSVQRARRVEEQALQELALRRELESLAA